MLILAQNIAHSFRVFCQHVMGPFFSWPHPECLLQVSSTTVTSVASVHVFLAIVKLIRSFSPYKMLIWINHISLHHSGLNPPPFLVKWNPGLDRHICGRLLSSVEKWSQNIFLQSRPQGLLLDDFQNGGSSGDHLLKIVEEKGTACA